MVTAHALICLEVKETSGFESSIVGAGPGLFAVFKARQDHATVQAGKMNGLPPSRSPGHPALVKDSQKD